jgi:putative oxidoreductase
MKAPFFIGRLIFGGFFLYNGIQHLRKHEEMSPAVRSKGVPAPDLAVTLSAAPLIIGGASLLLGVKPKVGTLALLGFLAGVSPIMHDFWRNQDPKDRMNNMDNFMKNMALAGASMALMGVDEPWEASVVKPKLTDRLRRAGRQLAA